MDPRTRPPEEAAGGDRPATSQQALDRLWSELYDELREVASLQMRHERRGHTLQTTALVNEAYLKVARQRQVSVDDRAQLLAHASRAIRNILVDHARSRAARQARERTLVGVRADDAPESGELAFDLLALDEALRKLSERSERQGRVVELRFFGGMSIDETARALGISPRTVDSEWQVARAWLTREMRGLRGGSGTAGDSTDSAAR